MTQIDIYNKALSLIPHDIPVTELTEGSKEASVCNAYWDDARLYCLASFPWSWATVSSPICVCEECNNKYAYPRPECVRIVGVFDTAGKKASMHSYNGMIYTCCSAGEIRYIPDNTDIPSWPVWFMDAIIAQLAYRISGAMSGSIQNSGRLAQLAVERLEEAKRIDAAECGFGGTDGKTFIHARQ